MQMQFTSFDISDKNSSKIIKSFVERTIETAYNRVDTLPGFYFISCFCYLFTLVSGEINMPLL